MVRIRLVWYPKRYMTKKIYRCKRYQLYLPKAIGEAIDTAPDYVARLIGPAIVIVSRGHEDFFSWLEKAEKARRENAANNRGLFTTSLTESSTTGTVDE